MQNPWNVPPPAPAGTSPEPDPPAPTLPSGTPDGIALDRDWRICAIGPAAAAVFGYTPAELLGQPVHTLIPHGLAAQSEAAASGTHPAGDCEEWVIGRSKDGRRFPLQFVAREPGGGAEREVALVLRRSSDLEAAPPLVPANEPSLTARERAHALYCQHEAEALRAAVTSVSQELAAARVVVTTLQHERDAWQGREAQARTHAEALERECTTHAQALAAARRETESGQAERQQLSRELLELRHAHTRTEQESRALATTTTDISRELAAARVVVETLRRERDLWQAQATAAQAEVATLQARLTTAERLHREREEAGRRVETLLRQALELAASSPPAPAPLSNTPAATA